MTHYCITDWDLNYEVNDKNGAWHEGDGFRDGPIPEIRIKARRDWNHRLLMLHQLVGEEMWAAIGMFEKLCQIVACERRSNRVNGVIRFSDGKPASLKQLAKLLLVSPAKMQWVIETLSHPDICWVTVVGPPESVVSGDSRKSGKGPDVPGFPVASEISAINTSHVEYNTEERKSKGIDTTGKPKPKSPSPPKQDLDDFSSEQFRRDYRMKLGKVLHAKTNSDVQAISNFERWLQENVTSGRAGPQGYRRALEIALDCVKGKNRLAVFWSRVAAEMRYDPPTSQMTGGP